jgi:hypothetical protein
LFIIVVIGEIIAAALLNYDGARSVSQDVYLLSGFGVIAAASFQFIYFDIEAGTFCDR